MPPDSLTKSTSESPGKTYAKMTIRNVAGILFFVGQFVLVNINKNFLAEVLGDGMFFISYWSSFGVAAAYAMIVAAPQSLLILGQIFILRHNDKSLVLSLCLAANGAILLSVLWIFGRPFLSFLR